MLSICYFEPAFEGQTLLTIGGRNHEIIQHETAINMLPHREGKAWIVHPPFCRYKAENL